MNPKCVFTNGREETQSAELVPSNYHDKDQDELLISISGPVSLGTLKEIIEWVKENAIVWNDTVLLSK